MSAAFAVFLAAVFLVTVLVAFFAGAAFFVVALFATVDLAAVVFFVVFAVLVAINVLRNTMIYRINA